MEGKDGGVGERIFKVHFSEHGKTKLGLRLVDMLKDYMDDCFDETLVEYIIVLLRNGRSKEEVKEELNVFLGDNSESFVTCLWDHLASHVDQYVQSHESCADQVEKPKPDMVEHAHGVDSHHVVVDSERGKSNKPSRSRHNRDWKGLVTDDTQPALRSSVTGAVENEEKVHRSASRRKQSASLEPPVHRKRDRPDERPRVKREVCAPRRLLQFAVREAVATAKPSNSAAEPARKRLRSVVSTSTGNSSVDVYPRRIQSVARLPNPMAAAIKAVAEAAEDVRKPRSGNVFDRLSCGVVVQESIEQVSTFGEAVVRDDNTEDYNEIHEERPQSYLRTRGYAGHSKVNELTVERSTGLASVSASDNEGYDDVHVMGRSDMDFTETGISGDNADESYRVQYSVDQDTDELMHQSRKREQEQPASASGAKHKIVNISVNVNTWKPPNYQPQRETVEVEARKSTQEIGTGAGNPNMRFMKENSNPLTVLTNGKPAPETQKESQTIVKSSAPGSYFSGRPLEDVDSRTIFVNNVHFGATKDSLSRHFNKFGEILKVIILTDMTGYPKGSAYVEFMRKEAAENALSLDGTSFMSRIIKVIKKSSAQQEANSMMTRGRVSRASPFPVTRYHQAPFPRVFPGTYRARPGIKPGARSMQWKRDSQQIPAESVASASGSATIVPSAGRGLTYVRTESKPDGNPGGA